VKGVETLVRKFGPIVLILSTLFAAVITQGCNPSGQTGQGGGTANGTVNAGSASIPAAASSPRNFDDYESSLEQVRTARFAHIYVFSRKDGGVFTPDDITYLKANAPERTNQWVKTSGGRKIIAGTNFEFTPENLDVQRKRFNVEDFPGR